MWYTEKRVFRAGRVDDNECVAYSFGAASSINFDLKNKTQVCEGGMEKGIE